MYKDLLKFYLSLSDPNNKSTIDSKIITYQHIELISKWINRLEIMDKLNSPYKFQLLFRGSRDGFSGEKFHETCDNRYRTVTVIKAKDSNEILGGYNPVEWRSDGSYGTTKDSFIFSFDNDDRIENYILSRVMNECYATFNGIFSGPSFGWNDLTILGMSYDFGSFCLSKKNFYEKLIRKTENVFTVEEFEVFQIV
ncbi:carbohydrate-binding module family 13 protein [Rhizophagus irregularis DAOM 181602=DAOM 197198]|nr:carbohydrate-binding module family 13 protein [Rhizophagus irregularis DAOM 181602=DAOM 197198]